MKTYQLDDMIGGWFIGDFQPSVIRSKDVEVGIKRFQAKETFEPHYHKLADEVTVIIEGKVRINQKEYGPGSIILQEKNEISDFSVIEDTVIAAVKMPSVINDKYIAGGEKVC